MKSRWILRETEDTQAEKLQRLLSDTRRPISMAGARMLAAAGLRELDDVARFYKPYKKSLSDPFLLLDMEKAVNKIMEVVDRGGKIAVYTDYDADGVTTAAQFKNCFAIMGVQVDVFLPNRFQEGYGLHVGKLKEEIIGKYDLVITGDTGIRGNDGAEATMRSGLTELIITDHHDPVEGRIRDRILQKTGEDIDLSGWSVQQIEDKLKELDIVPKNCRVEVVGEDYIALPYAHAIINPKRLGDPYPCKTLSGVAVVYKLFQALFQKRGIDEMKLIMTLDNVAAGLVADMVHHIDVRHNEDGVDILDFEVRSMIQFGIRIINDAPKVWVRSICEVMNLNGKLDEGHLGFNIGPMLNAPGRLDDPRPAYELLTETDPEASLELADRCKTYNDTRKAQIESAVKLVKEECTSDYGVFIASEHFHIGIAGLVATRFKDFFYRPTVAVAPVMKNGKEVWKGSARSIRDIHMLDVLDQVKEDIGHFEYGGHEGAAGLTLYPEQLEPFGKSFAVRCQAYGEETFIKTYEYHAEVAPEDITFQFYDEIEGLKPYGQGNPKPVYRLNGVTVRYIDPKKNGGLYHFYSKAEGRTYQFKGKEWNRGAEIIPKWQELSLSKSKIAKEKGLPSEDVYADVLFNLTVNEWNGEKKLELDIVDIKYY
ncbi:DHH family phosphoesterase [Paenibacillus cremeus]|uniref:Single-stranded-DNA-specific exonuclease RecJ n=1 Tax=Paenibacillus cremeus TaxID=2163881 RepID=A0A559K4A0_9BACL|nr:DHH family phosphoesterase [Paenibacillus cremeus]TVY06920.1 hypothetical protein FPZ49_26765 [Paenibacillus cremeus]